MMLRLIPRLGDEKPDALLAAGLPVMLSRVLWARGVHTEAEAEAFLHPALSSLHDPWALHDMAPAVSRIQTAIERQERITVFGDYDVDGVCATALLVEAFRAHGANVGWYIPSRHREGYGLSEDAVRAIARDSSLLITVDCGITSTHEAEVAGQIGLDLIITDHHEPPQRLPAALAVVNPMLGAYPFRRLCGAGVAFKLVQALFGLEKVLPQLELAALATVADLVPLLSENRVLVHAGLACMQATKRVGLRALFAVSGLEGKVITAGHLGFQIGPRINAGGRLDDAARGVELLLTKDVDKAARIARTLDEENTKRQRMEEEILSQADQWVKGNMDFLSQRVIVVVGQEWNTGVVGLAASKLVEKYAWPAVVLSERDGICTGSARSIPGVNLYAALARCEDLFIRFGGHAQAAGMTLAAEKVPEFRRRLDEAVGSLAEKDAFIPTAAYDLDIMLDEVTPALVEQMERLAPNGFGNPSPVFRLSGAHVLEARCVGYEGKHLKLRLEQRGAALDGIAFSQGALRAELPESVDALFSPSINEYMGKRSVQCEVARILPYAPAVSFRERCLRDPDLFDCYLLDREAQPTNAMEETTLKALVAEALTDSCQGTLLTVQTVEGACRWLDWLEAEGLSARLDYSVGASGDMRRFNTLCAMPGPEAGMGFARVFSLDDACVAGAAAAWMPTDEALRELYRTLRSGFGHFFSEAALARAAGLKTAAVRLGLRVFAELNLASYRPEPFEAIVLAPKKCSLDDSTVLRRARQVLGR